MAKKKNKCNTLGIVALCILFFILGMVCLYVLNNFTTKPIYKFVSCTNNKHSCSVPGWDGQCSPDIRNKCCVDIRYCEGDVGYGYQCLDKYCTNEGETCEPFTTVYGYECRCTVV